MDTEERAKRGARLMPDQYAGVVARSREADPGIGESSPAVIIFQSGEMPDPE
ncbi:hypothetical protein AAIH70_25600 [Neorhizobium sp. BT27B]|uniref:hypothetical protein n=1 Tax=Neorhizobium sp. BT27B TaxID=3142625 RepID=UPI003D2CF819